MNPKRPPLKQGDVYPAHVLRDEYGMNAANRPVIVVDEKEVPEAQRFLIPTVERWAISCDVTRGDYFEQQPKEDIAKFWYDVLPFVESIKNWLDSQPEDVREWPDAAVHFMYFIKAHREAWQPTEEEVRQMSDHRAAWVHVSALKKAVASGLEAFKARDYETVVNTLTPFTDELDKVIEAKLAYARRKTGG